MRNHGMTSGTFQRFSKRTVGYDVTMLGYNYRMDDLRAAVGLAQLNSHCLEDRCPNVGFPFKNWPTSSWRATSCHIMSIILPEGVERQAVIDGLRDVGIQT